MPLEKRALLIAGPTASGKSALALKRAVAEVGVVINADALQVYRELRILTARPSVEDEARAPHKLYGQVSAAEAYSVGRWLADARAALDEVWAEGRLAVVTGGTGLYFRVLEQGLAEVPPIPGEVRRRWREFAGDLHAELARRDAAAAERLDPRDRQRLARALEVIDGTGHPLAHWHTKGAISAPLAGAAVERLWLDAPRAELYRRADARFDAMVATGALDEVANLNGFDAKLPAMMAIGVEELRQHLTGELSLEIATANAKTATRNYIKRQLTWWRGELPRWTLIVSP